MGAAAISSLTIAESGQAGATQQQPEPVIVLWNRNFDTAPVNKFIELALAKTEDLYPQTRLLKSKPMEQGEAIKDMLNGNRLDVMSAASSQHDDNFFTLRFPILKGLLGKRVCLIRSGEQSRFNQIRTAFDFSQANLSICQGSDWPDTKILRRNGLNVVTSPHYQEIFTLLKQGDCDCFLRGAQEILPELIQHNPELELEKKFVIQYSQPGVIYLRKSNGELATRIELGLLRAFEDGSYQQLLNQELDESLSLLKLKKRRKILLNNPSPSETLRQINRINDFDS